MKKVAIVVLIILGLGYVGQAQKAVRVNQLRLKWKLKDGKITQQQYEEQVEKISFGAMLLNPKAVLSVD